ncbi:phosphoketolase family protein [Pseudomonas sp. 10B1]|uniref:phosphoketolase family protein n=1 Tax=unclassified Pseudomonas TaxID=196821 RepID=UPI002AB4CDD0|nr:MULTISPECIES: phosphoketolase family protein [unclassified Pseudomonas]MDY7560611.1 phosphoketolase family protein [Pseudomonas sp. AB6]MEA9993367.1 phosphoketolase family protein [Pseudomonas sp. AA4]MEB0088383.1 phosphoketolase family protein [Pseudomonas sp. RTI1]MEB0124146.1 phosphoketolase family protein [Pseudomonas sp. CCC1.2]MEB0152605.1 phosphoketolase family protein [Pseudomonas sp. CCC4.3]
MYIFNPLLSSADNPSTAPIIEPPSIETGPLAPELLERMNRYWYAANYLCVGQIYLKANPLLREPLTAEHIKPRLLGHWGTSAGQNFIYVHLNRLISEQHIEMIYISGPGHGGPTLNACAWLEGTYSDVHPEITADEPGMLRFFRSFSTPGGVPSHCGPHTPNSLHEGGELGYSLVHAFGAAFDNPQVVVACVIGDGEAETCPLEGSWKSVRFLNPVYDGAVLPILHLNGYKISGPTVEARTDDADLIALYQGRGYEPIIVAGDDVPGMHQRFAAALDSCYAAIRDIQHRAREQGVVRRSRWPMIILRSPKGWTGPKAVDGMPVEGTFRAHQVPLANVIQNAEHLAQLERWMRSYSPQTLFDENGTLVAELRALTPPSALRMGAVPHVNGGRVLVTLDLPNFADYAVDVPGPGEVIAEAPRKLGEYLRDVIRANPDNFRVFGPDETNSNRLNAVFEATNRTAAGPVLEIDDHLAADGRVMEVLSEHLCEGWLEGYLLTGRHGMWSTYEAFAQVVDSMVTQHAKWLQQSREFAWRRPLASLNILLTSHAWRNDHNGFSHQSTGFVDNVLQRRSDVVRVYYPPDSNCLVNVFDHCLRSRNYVNVVTCGKQPDFQWLDFDAALKHCSQGASIWDFASNDEGDDPDVVLACAGDVPTTEAVAASWLLQKHVPGIRVRLVNVVDLGILSSPQTRPHGMDNVSFDALFTREAPVMFAFHGSTWVIHSMVHGRANEARFHVRGFSDRGTTTTPFDMVVLNDMSRYQLAIDALSHVPRLRSHSLDAMSYFEGQLRRHHTYIREHFEDMPEIRNWHWTSDFSEPDGPPPLAKGHPRGQTFTDA